MSVLRVYDGPIQDGADGILVATDAGAGAGRIEIRTGAQPAVNGATTGTLLATFTLQDPAWPASAASGTGATATLNGLPITDASADATGTAGYGVMMDSTGAIVLTGDVTANGGGGVFEIDNTSIVIGQEVQLTGADFTLAQTKTV